uniref:Endoplasmic reticulum transmembrane protein n=1 Tax=Paramormyrops kingsleyae TaxID=1676925 RepID=A0A3B3R3B8_9TELE
MRYIYNNLIKMFAFEISGAGQDQRTLTFRRMTLQWTAVATFLYVEIGVLLILCLPFISAKRWQSVFRFRVWNALASFWNKAFLTMIIILIVLFLDAVREVRKYSGEQLNQNSKLQPNMFDHLHMKLFRSQRNLYISGFSLFLWLVMRRVIMLINQLASVTETGVALQTQAENANQVAKKYMEDCEELKKTLDEGKTGRKMEEGNAVLKKEVEKLTQELRTTDEALKKSQAEVKAVRRQAEGLTQEYERLLQEHHVLQNLHQGDEGDKKSQ